MTEKAKKPGGKGFHRLPGVEDDKYMKGHEEIWPSKRFHGRPNPEEPKQGEDE